MEPVLIRSKSMEEILLLCQTICLHVEKYLMLQHLSWLQVSWICTQVCGKSRKNWELILWSQSFNPEMCRNADASVFLYTIFYIEIGDLLEWLSIEPTTWKYNRGIMYKWMSNWNNHISNDDYSFYIHTHTHLHTHIYIWVN